MKKFLYKIRWCIYIGLFITASFDMGFRFSMVTDDHPIERWDHTREEVATSTIMLSHYTDSVFKLRDEQTKSGDRYRYDEYLADLARFYNKEFSLGFNRATISSSLNFSRVMGLTEKGVTESDKKIAYDIYYAICGEHLPLTEDSRISNEETVRWWRNAYLQNLLYAGLLYLFWLLIDAKASKYIRRNPLSSLFALTIYPIVLCFLIYEKFREKARRIDAEIDYRRTKDKFFSILSRDEIGRIQTFVHSGKKLWEWNEELKSEGRVFKHSFFTVFLFTIFCSFFVQNLSAHSKTQPQDQRSAIYQFVKEKTDVHPELHDVFPMSEPLLPDIIPWEEPTPSLRIWWRYFLFFIPEAYVPDIGHVPDGVNISLMKMKLIC